MAETQDKSSTDGGASYVASNGASFNKKFANCPPRLYDLRIKSGAYSIIDDLLHKRCPRCKDYWPADTEFFYSTPSQADGLYQWCKACYQQWRKGGRKTVVPASDEKNSVVEAIWI